MAKICIIGFGCVGSGTYEIIKKNCRSIARRAGEEIEVKYIVDIRDFSSHEESHLFTTDFDKVLNDEEVSIVVETMGGTGPAYDYTISALENGKNVVTSNKELVAIKGDELFAIAKAHGVKYFYEASVGGGIPIIRPMITSLSPNEINEITGILNGTTNYILTKMFKESTSFEEALKTAQELGYAERNPAADVEGHDTCKKISILSSMVIGKKVNYEDVHTEGITNITYKDTKYAEKLDCSIKLLGRFRHAGGSYEAVVAPMLVENSNPLAGVEDVFNGIFVNGDMLGDAMFYGRGAGKLPTASAVTADIIEIVKTPAAEFSIPWQPCSEKVIKDYEDIKSSFMVRIKTSDKHKTLSDVNSVFGTADALDLFDDEIAFTTGIMAVKELSCKLSQFDVLNTFMIL